MIRTVVRVSALSLLRDRMALALTFLLPLVFFSFFAMVFGSMDEAGGGRIETTVVVEDSGAHGARFAELLQSEPQLALHDGVSHRDEARELVRRGRVAVAVVVPEGFSEAFEQAAAGWLAMAFSTSMLEMFSPRRRMTSRSRSAK